MFESYKNAYQNVSFDYDKRFNSFVSDYESIVNNATAYAKESGVEDLLPGYIKKLTIAAEKYLSVTCRCASSFIVGPSRFPTARMEKINRLRDLRLNAYSDLCNYDKHLRIVEPRLLPEKQAEVWEEELKHAEKWHVIAKKTNVLIRKNDIEGLKELGFDDDYINFLIANKGSHACGCNSYQLSNNLAKINRLKAQIAQIRYTAAVNKDDTFTVGNITVKHDPLELRWNLEFPEKPNEKIRWDLKKHGFKWSPSRNAWTRGSKTMPKNYLKEILEDAIKA